MLRRMFYITLTVFSAVVLAVSMTVLVPGILGNVTARNYISYASATMDTSDTMKLSTDPNDISSYNYYTSQNSEYQLYLKSIYNKIDKNYEGDLSRPPGTPIVHDIVPGETLSTISSSYGISVDELVEQNHIFNPNLIYSGSALQIPASK